MARGMTARSPYCTRCANTRMGCIDARCPGDGASLHYAMTRARARATALGNLAGQYGCTADGACCAGGACDTVTLWLQATNVYDRARDAWIAAGRPE